MGDGGGTTLARRGFLVLGIGLAMALAVPAATRAAPTFTAVATTGMVGDIVAHVAGEAGRVESLLGEGVDPHTYKATRADIARLMAADIVFYNGLLLEGKMTDALIRVASSGKPVIAVTEGLEEGFLLEPEEFAGQYDPHVWMDPRGWMAATEVVRDRLSDHYPEHAEAFRANAVGYLAQLERLDLYVREVLESVPPERRVLVTAHDAFNYFGRAYGFEVQGIQGISTESEAGLHRIEELVALLVERQIPAVFPETTVSDRNVWALVEGAAARGHRVVVGGALFSDAMGAPGTYEGSYLGMIDHNASTIAWALGGEVPAGGMDGRLARLGD